MKFNDSPHQRGARFHEDNQNKGHGQDRNSVYQAHLQFALEATQQQKSHRNMLVQPRTSLSGYGSQRLQKFVYFSNLRRISICCCYYQPKQAPENNHRLGAKPNTSASATPDEEERITWPHASKLNDESPLAHAGDLVICKKRRQDRRVGPASPSSQGRASPLSRGSGQQTTRWAQQQGSGGAGGLSPGVKAEAQWAKPVKRMRTDTGKRRHGHM
ncbi:uncharacterized protein A4U43_UnF7360 [Asparagus officinalis]|uniref:Uncharacterized protein n=1 Tax=Asparagus officinalis TaxID=4686 RepID=A0A1R3L672_ASPOF|nr:uncharacterized protein A4U43_UnF7360 [Asparagus officinalis]